VGIAVVAAMLVVLAAVLWGRALLSDGAQLFLSAPPFAGEWRWQWTGGMWLVLVTALGLVALWPTAAHRLPWSGLVVGSTVSSFLWTMALAASDGVAAIASPLTTHFESLPFARAASQPDELLRNWANVLPQAPTHVQGHPPGTVLTFMGLDRLGFSDLAVAMVVVFIAASSASAAIIALDRLAGRSQARRAAVFVGLAPAVVWAGTSVDGMAMGVAAWAVAAAAVATTTDEHRTASVAAVLSGLLAGALLTMTYGAPTLLGPLWATLAWSAFRRRPGPVVFALGGFLVPVAAMAIAGFDWRAGFSATHDAYQAGVASVRPAGYFLLANLAAVAVAAGPAAVAGAAGLRNPRAWLLVGGAVAGILAADLSGLSKGEVERIWLPFVPFLCIATCSLRGTAVRRWWLAAQLAVAIILQAWLRSPW